MSLDLGPRPIRLRGGRLRLPRHQGHRVLLAGLVLFLFVLLVGWISGGDATPAATAQEQDGVVQGADSGSAVDELALVPSGEPEVFATVDGLELWTPSGATLIVAYHEASFDDALAIEPIGRLRSNFNTTKYADPGVMPGPIYDIQASRGRTHGATSAVDLVLRDDETVRSLVTGTVVEVRPYSLYGRYPDTRIEIAPADRPDLRVVLIHVEDVQVAVGDELVAGETPIAGTANRFPFHSQVDRHLPDGPWPHVHVEVKRAG